MNINSTNSQSINQIQSWQAMDAKQSSHENDTLKIGAQAKEQEISISKAGHVGSYIANLPEADQQEIKEYLQSIREARADGSIDIESGINNAPEAFNKLANQLNLDSGEALHMMSKKLTNSSSEGGKSLEISAYSDVAAQKESSEASSIFDRLTSLFSSDS